MNTKTEQTIKQLQALADEPLSGDSEHGRAVQLLCDIPVNIFYDDAHRPIIYAEYVNYWCKHATIALVKRTHSIIRMYVIAPATELLTLIKRTHGIVAQQVIDVSMIDNDTEL